MINQIYSFTQTFGCSIKRRCKQSWSTIALSYLSVVTKPNMSCDQPRRFYCAAKLTRNAIVSTESKSMRERVFSSVESSACYSMHRRMVIHALNKSLKAPCFSRRYSPLVYYYGSNKSVHIGYSSSYTTQTQGVVPETASKNKRYHIGTLSCLNLTLMYRALTRRSRGRVSSITSN